MAGTYWDDAWHTDKGRDSFLIAPHILLYVGITVAGFALGLWMVGVVREIGLRAALRDPRVLLATIGLAVTLGAAPIDNGWHLAFGRDAVLWSPPHMLGVAGSLAIAAALLLAMASARSVAGKAAAQVAAAAVLAVAVIPVLEYETDVPQFDPLWYLPALAFGSAFALGLIRLVLPGAWSATRAAALYTLLRILITAGLLAAGTLAPLVPLLIVPALILDLTISRGWNRPSMAAAFSIALFAVYVPYLNWVKSDIFLDLSDVLIGLPLAGIGSYLGLSVVGQPRGGHIPPRSAAAAALLLALLFPGSASAHDPGQGEEVTLAAMEARTQGASTRLTVDLTAAADCSSFHPGSIVARRAGQTVTAPLRSSSACEFKGAIVLPERGRWFVYSELEQDGSPLESWLPVHAGGNSVVSAERSVYVPSEDRTNVLKFAAGIVVFGFLAAVIAGVAIAARRQVGPPNLPEGA